MESEQKIKMLVVQLYKSRHNKTIDVSEELCQDNDNNKKTIRSERMLHNYETGTKIVEIKQAKGFELKQLKQEIKMKMK